MPSATPHAEPHQALTRTRPVLRAMRLTPQPRVLTGTVSHRRSAPRENGFCYSIYYLMLPLPAAPLPSRWLKLAVNDLGARDGRDPSDWARSVLRAQAWDHEIAHLVLVSLPSVCGYAFNPISFYLCLDGEQRLRAVIGEVHNTYGEQHVYFCARPDRAPLTADQWLAADKCFHVSPFFPRDGHYRFRFDLDDHRLRIWIDHWGADQQLRLSTCLSGTLAPLTSTRLRRVFWQHPLVTLKVIGLIHWQALRLALMGLPFRRKPEADAAPITSTQAIDPSAPLERAPLNEQS